MHGLRHTPGSSHEKVSRRESVGSFLVLGMGLFLWVNDWRTEIKFPIKGTELSRLYQFLMPQTLLQIYKHYSVFPNFTIKILPMGRQSRFLQADSISHAPLPVNEQPSDVLPSQRKKAMK
jgi:hypothetical protein